MRLAIKIIFRINGILTKFFLEIFINSKKQFENFQTNIFNKSYIFQIQV
jgi:hypothetical protein